MKFIGKDMSGSHLNESNYTFATCVETLISNTLFNNLVKTMKESLGKNGNGYRLVITGTIGSGKSTVCQLISNIFSANGYNINAYPEFVNVQPEKAIEMLKRKLEKDASTYEFQNYILDTWEMLFEEHKNKSGISIFERCIDDSVLCFCKYDVMNGKMNNEEYERLRERALELDSKYQMFGFFPENFNIFSFERVECSKLELALVNIITTVINDINHGIMNRMIGLYVSGETSKERIHKRLRDGESAYSDDDIENYVKMYNDLYMSLL